MSTKRIPLISVFVSLTRSEKQNTTLGAEVKVSLTLSRAKIPIFERKSSDYLKKDISIRYLSKLIQHRFCKSVKNNSKSIALPGVDFLLNNFGE